MASMIEIKCECGCGRKRLVRTADRKRGWGRYFDKSCKARHQEKTTGKLSSRFYDEEWQRRKRWARDEQTFADEELDAERRIQKMLHSLEQAAIDTEPR